MEQIKKIIGLVIIVIFTIPLIRVFIYDYEANYVGLGVCTLFILLSFKLLLPGKIQKRLKQKLEGFSPMVVMLKKL